MERERPRQNYKDVADFLRRSWYELPEGPSNARFMKPGCKKESFTPLSLSQKTADASTQTSNTSPSGTGEQVPETSTTPSDEGTSQRSFRKLALYVSICFGLKLALCDHVLRCRMSPSRNIPQPRLAHGNGPPLLIVGATTAQRWERT